MGNPRYVVKYMLNTLLLDVRTRGPSMRLISEDAFNTEEEALAFYRERKTVNAFGAGSDAHVVCYPVYVEDHTPTPIPSGYCDSCGEPYFLKEAGEGGEEDLGFTDLPNGNFCSRACFRNAFQDASEDDNHDGDYDDGGY
jgi:hypothetical protein